MCGLEIADAANKLACHMGNESFKASDGWLCGFCNHHGIGNKVKRGESGSSDINAVEPFRLKFNTPIKKENLHLGWLYNVDETGLFWRSLLRNSQAFTTEDKIPGKKISK